MQASQDGSGPLEDRLRSLIISNTEGTTTHALQSSATSTRTGSISLEDGSKVKQGWPEAGQSSPSTQAPPKAGKKRPNQAERRKMRAQLSIPIDTRAPAPYDGKPYANSHHTKNQRSTWHNTEQDTFRPPLNAYNYEPQGRATNPPFSNQRRHQGRFGQVSASVPGHQPPQRQQQPYTQNPFSKGVNVISADSFAARGPAPAPSQSCLYHPNGQHQPIFDPEQLANESAHLDELCRFVITGAEIEPSEIAEKEYFRAQVEAICRDAITRHEIEINGNLGFQPYTVELKCFGSLASGFATKAADMDVGLLSPMSWSSPESPDSPIPRLIEKALLEHGFGARLLTRTRVPIIKLCEKPGERLRLDLLDARAKWEKGIVDDSNDAADDVIDDQDAPDGAVAALAVAEIEHSSPSNQDQDSQTRSGPVGRTYEEQLSSLKQSDSQSLVAYYHNAKRLLRRLNGRDITISNATDFKDTDYKVLDDVANAFINGLHDGDLKRRIQAYPSFSFDVTSEPPNRRSLIGVFMMAEGEQLATIWETQAMIEKSIQLRPDSKFVVQTWKDIMCKKIFGTEPLTLNRELHLALEHLRKIPLVQLIQLKQDQYESPTQYHTRAIQITNGLCPARPSSNKSFLPEISQHYISGIRDKYVRDEVQKFANSTGVQNLRTLARKHKTIHLVTEYERAIEKGLYREEDIPAIKEYMEILQGDFLHQTPATDKPIVDAFDFIVPATKKTTELVGKIRQLPDPSKLAPNKPRDRYHDSLEFPKNGVGVQCDINFSAHLALQNTLLLRCYSYTDPRVRPMVLFVKHWAKARGINTPYRGTLSSYGYVLMVLHYLVNVAVPFVCPNLQQLAPPDPNLPAEDLEDVTTCKGWNVRFWRDEEEIQRLAHQGHLNQNQESLGSLLRGFFEYYAQNNVMSTTRKRGFDWGRDVLSLRTHGGRLSKQKKGWTGAKTVLQLETGALPDPAEAGVNHKVKSPIDGMIGQQATTNAQFGQFNSLDGVPVPPTKPKDLKEVRHRYLFAIEDPFELEHNVARTVTHNGIVSIRDEFRRAWRIIRTAGKNGHAVENLLEDVNVESEKTEGKQFTELLEEMHGPGIFLSSVTN
ncbi:uncharacterized protein F4817DRAFT_323547 [Daldinia loculata]|uniref:uncharacterized protein n=1 Tax=Daldinia loculata TaxID=103429 RepID=UPI0020C3890B|nr:uncharacterized protein F4817DRAFT_323547 [Daldinia loculata]KAI1651766.1 hypothetical protein F4817DRAFT_323547 [Daldinia loculata]